ncbi:DNA-binding GntR family transcriptional regulator [Anoxybacillus tepidamans]|uniref:DNA-binding GntR family transcriptional regulator n=1 Tax=Anoxybacteroides tepidamans TaxID=265948 RepID=A0A7W8ITL5_9BACL|nr:GntR family transcriptional regulator [Anoxybacillus tepidamans]MBB5325494.1 DNA-binding GntR family transcriptional regulator [Anoxybacillus tepidamans]
MFTSQQSQQIKSSIRGSARDQLYDLLKEKILRLELEPGTKISEKEIAEQLHISRTPVREAFLKLAQEELLDIIPQSGTIVSRINLEHVEEGRFIREVVEKEVAALACKKFSEEHLFQLEKNITMQELCVEKRNFLELFELDEKFHQAIFDGCRMSRSWKMVQNLNSHFNRLRVLRLFSDLDWDIIISHHKQIYRLIANKEAEKVRQVMEEHLQLVVIEKDVLKKQYPHYFV